MAEGVVVKGFAGASAWSGAVRELSPLDAAGRVVGTVLMIDNCEHVLAGAAAVIGTSFSNASLAVLPYTEQHRVVYVLA